MKPEKHFSLTPQQRTALIMAVKGRNAMEDFYVKHLLDAQMKELNPIIRQALLDAVTILEDEDDERRGQRLAHLVSQIPTYWEIPEPAEWIGNDQEVNFERYRKKYGAQRDRRSA